MENTKEVLHKIMTLSSILFEKTAPGGKALDFGWHSYRSYKYVIIDPCIPFHIHLTLTFPSCTTPLTTTPRPPDASKTGLESTAVAAPVVVVRVTIAGSH